MQPVAKRNWEREHHLTVRGKWEHVINQVGRGFSFVSAELAREIGTTRGAETPFFTAKRYDLFFCTTAALKSQETIGRNPAFNERFEFIYDVLWERSVFCLTRLNEAVQVLVYDFEARRKLGATPLVFRGFRCLLCHPRNKALQRAKWQRPRTSADDFAGTDILCE
jgi:hypothetical protein